LTPASTDQADRQSGPLLELRGLQTYYPVQEGLFQRVVGVVRALDGVDLVVQPGETVGLVGESGSGKTTLAKAIMGLAPVTAGEIRLAGQRLPARISDRPVDLRRGVQMVFQDVSTSLNPRRTVGGSIADPLVVNRIGSPRDRRRRVAALLEMVELPTAFANRYPHELSGGERQRVGVARALALAPRLLVLDEPTSALDVSVQAKVVDLLTSLQRQLDLTYILISHDLALVRDLANRVAVMYLGRLMEEAETRPLFETPRNPYTACLLTAVPTLEPAGERTAPLDHQRLGLRVLPGEPPSPRNPPSGCVFHPRCPLAQPRCREEAPAFRLLDAGQASRCHFDLQRIEAPPVSAVSGPPPGGN
jgi:oligopeptide/dipeptide ABC transporter ATP-binding protein